MSARLVSLVCVDSAKRHRLFGVIEVEQRQRVCGRRKKFRPTFEMFVYHVKIFTH